MECDGQCNNMFGEKCSGKVRPVMVRSTAKSPDPYLLSKHRFNYCDTAIKKDEENGYEVKEI